MSLMHIIEHAHDALAWEGDMPTQARYTVGIAGEKFFREIKDNGQFLGTVCPACGITYIPPRLYCEQCFGHLEEWVEVSPTGRVHTFTVVHLDLDGNPLPEPRILAFVHLDGTDGGLVHNLGEVQPDQVCIGMCVEAVFRDKADRRGSILDVAYFKPVQRGVKVNREPVLKGVFPGLMIRLLGIPVGFCLNAVASETLHSRSLQRQREGLVIFVLIILFYLLHSVGLYMLFEVGRRLTNQLPDSRRRFAWQRYLLLRILAVGPVTVFVVGTLMAIGISFENASVQFFSWPLNPWMLMQLSFVGYNVVYAMIFAAAPLSRLIEEYPLLLPYSIVAMVAGFVVLLFASPTFAN